MAEYILVFFYTSPQAVLRPSTLAKYLTLRNGNVFINISVTISVVRQYMSRILTLFNNLTNEIIVHIIMYKNYIDNKL